MSINRDVLGPNSWREVPVFWLESAKFWVEMLFRKGPNVITDCDLDRIVERERKRHGGPVFISDKTMKDAQEAYRTLNPPRT